MVLVAFEMISDELAEYLTNMDKYDRELMILEHRILEFEFTSTLSGWVK